MKWKLAPIIVILAILPTFLPSAVELEGATASPSPVAYSTTNPSFEAGMDGWDVKLMQGDAIAREEGGYYSKFSIRFKVSNGSELFAPTQYLQLNDTLCLTVALKDIRPLADVSYLEIDVLALWSRKRVIPIHLIIKPGLGNDTYTYIDGSGVYIAKGAEADGWAEYRLRLGSYKVRELMVEYLRRAYNEALAHPSDDFLVKFIYVRPHNLEGCLDQVGMGYLLPGVMKLHFESRSLLPMSTFVSKVVSRGCERPFTVEGSYSFTITYAEQILASDRIPIEVEFRTGQRVSANVAVPQPDIIWV